MTRFTTFSASYLRSLLTQEKIPPPRISFRVKTTDIYNKYYLYSITCSDRSSVLEVVDFTFSYAPVAGIKSICIIISIESA